MEKKSFDLKTHVRNKKGHIESFNHYRLRVIAGKQYFERPPSSGKYFDAAGNPIEGPDVSNADKEVSDKKAAELLAAENAKLKAELAALSAPKVPEIKLDEVIAEAKKR